MSNVSVKIQQFSDQTAHRYQQARDPYSLIGIGGPTYEMQVTFNSGVFYCRHQVDRFFHEELAHRHGTADEIIVKRLTDVMVGHLRGEIEAEIRRQVLAKRPIRAEDYANIIVKG